MKKIHALRLVKFFYLMLMCSSLKSQVDSIDVFSAIQQSKVELTLNWIDKKGMFSVFEVDTVFGLNLLEYSILYHENEIFDSTLNRILSCKKIKKKIFSSETPISIAINSGNSFALKKLFAICVNEEYLKSGRIWFDYSRFVIDYYSASSIRGNDSEFLAKMGANADIDILEELLKVGSQSINALDENNQNVLFKIYPYYHVFERIIKARGLEINSIDNTNKTVSDYIVNELLSQFRIQSYSSENDLAFVKKLDSLGFKTFNGKGILNALYDKGFRRLDTD